MVAMQITIAAVGQLKSGPEQELFEHYLKRLRQHGGQCGLGDIIVRETPEDRARTATERRRNETAKLATLLPQKSSTIALDENGKAFSSVEFANRIAHWRDIGTARLGFLIGGPDGLGREIKQAAGEVFSLGRLTWPHRLARVLLAEQLYRTATILTGHPYHRT